jgi:sigma-B regulation protein RsbU (phosphoserine phosphatase)
MTLASAGMPGPLHFSGETCRILELSGIPPGLFPEISYDSLTVKLSPGDSLLVCSDGIIEAQNARYEDFGVERLVNLCHTGRDMSQGELLNRIFAAVHDFTDAIQQHDDMAAAIFHLGC